jgi:hypothetical protein
MSDAIRGRHYDIMNYLQGKGGERPDAEVDSLVTKLLTAAAAGDMRKVTEALDDGANANSAVWPLSCCNQGHRHRRHVRCDTNAHAFAGLRQKNSNARGCL